MDETRPTGESLIRGARREDTAALHAIEVSAGAVFRSIGMDAIADDAPPSYAVLHTYIDAGRAWVAVDPTGGPIAYVLVDIVDGAAHIEQVSLDQEHRGRRIGRRLIEEVASWSRKQGLGRMTLTTFADVPWNAPYYRRLGFAVLSDDDLTAGLRAIRAREAAHGLDRWPRVTMMRAALAVPAVGR